MSTPHCTVLLTIALASNAVAQTGWVLRQPTTRPPARFFHALTFDLVRGRTVLFGGHLNGSFFASADQWEWDGTNWTQRFTAHTPPARGGHGLAADLLRSRVVLFGGSPMPIGGALNDTWEYDGIDWTQILPAIQPSARNQTRMEYDAARARTVLFGGGTAGATITFHNDTWEWDGASWTQRSPAASPLARWWHSMAYDIARSRIVLFGGRNDTMPFADTWTWDGTNWTQMPSGLNATSGHSISYDPGHDRVVCYGGQLTVPETWLFDHFVWRRDPRAPFAHPGSWVYCTLAHDVLRGRTVLFGGSIGTGGTSSVPTNDTWEYDPGTVARWTVFGSGCAGNAGVPALQRAGGSLPVLGTNFVLELLGVPGAAAMISFGFSSQQWNGNTLPFGLGALGMTGCTLHASPDVVFFAPVTTNRATLAWALPNNTSLIGVTFFNQGFVLDPGINPLGATVSNAGTGIIGPF